MAWYSGWYNGLAHKHFMDYRKGRVAEHDVIEYCEAHLDERIIHAIGIVFKDIRAEERMGSWPCPSRVSRSKLGDDSETSVSCPRKRASRLGRAVPGRWIPAFAGMSASVMLSC